MCPIRRFVSMSYSSEHEAVLVPNSDSDISAGAQANGYVARTVQRGSRIKFAFEGSKYTCLEEVRQNKQDFLFLLLHDFSNSVGLHERVHTH